jgi:uncharacterized membrane protein YdjX (TVP38/TMEM64 family)
MYMVFLSNKRIVSILFFMSLLALVYYFTPLKSILTLENFQHHKDHLLHATQEHYWRTVILYILAYIASTALALPEGSIMSITAGFLFDVRWGSLFALIGATLGASLAFVIVRRLAKNYVQAKYKKELAKLNKAIETQGTQYLLIARLIPFFPFFLVNILAPLSHVKVTTFMWTTALGIIPSTVLYAYAGQQLRTAHTVKDFLGIQIGIMLILLVLVLVIPQAIKKLQVSHKKNQ